MDENVTYRPKIDPSIYPGIYQPLQNREQKLIDELDKKGVKISRPPVNVIQQPDHYRIEMPAPDFRNEDFIIKTNGSLLSIFAEKPQVHKPKPGHYNFSKLHCDCIKSDIDLPADADSDFGTAEYSNGMLYIYLYRGNCPVQNGQNHIIVY